MVCVSVRLLASVYKKRRYAWSTEIVMYMFLLSRDYIYVSDFSFLFFFFYESVLLLDNILKVMIYAFFIIFYAFYGYILRQSVCRIFNALCLLA